MGEKLFSEKQLRYLAKAILQDIKGLNPYEKKNVFKHGKYKTNHLVRGSQFYNDSNFESWSNVEYITPNVEKIDGKTFSVDFRTSYNYSPKHKDNFNDKVIFNKNITEKELYILIAELHDKVEDKILTLTA